MNAEAAVGVGRASGALAEDEVVRVVEEAVAASAVEGQRLLLIIPDHTRTAPVGLLFKALHARTRGRVRQLDVLIALGTHPPMSEAMINDRLGLTAAERSGVYGDVQVYNHLWQDPAALTTVGTIPAEAIEALSEGRFAMDVVVTLNRLVLAYDQVWILGPVFPHEVVGFSGGNKYLFPGVSGREIIDFFHWLGAVITNPRIIGNKDTPVRRVLDRAAGLVPGVRRCLALVVKGQALAGLYFGTPEAAWSAAADLSGQVHIEYHNQPYRTVFSCAPAMYDDLWTGGKCMYKLEPVVADGGELIIYAPHITEISETHGAVIKRVGYHTRDYFLAQWEKFQSEPWGVLAHSTHVRGIGSFADGEERGRIAVTLATGIPEGICRRVGLGYRDPASLDPRDYQGREAEGILYVPKAGEILHKLKDPPAWQQPLAE